MILIPDFTHGDYMAQLTIGKAADLVGKTRQALYRKIKSGELSVTLNHDSVQVVDTSELLRVFGEFKYEDSTTSTNTNKLDVSKQPRTSARTTHKEPENDAVTQALELGELRASAKYLERMLEAAEARALSAEARAAAAESRAIEAITMNQKLLVDLQSATIPEQEGKKKGKRSVIK